MSVARTVLAVTLAACTPEPAGDGPGPVTTTASPTVPPDTDVDTDVPSDPQPTADTGTTTPWLVDVDCSAIPAGPRPYVRHTWAPGAEDFTFSPDGYMLSVSTGSLKRTPYGGPAEVMVPGLADVRGTRMLPDGRLALAAIDTAAVMLLDPVTGAASVLANLQNPNGIAIGLDGKVYVATTGAIRRVDPATGVVETVVDMPGNSFDGLTFSPDFTRLYFNEELGQVHWVDFDAAGQPAGLGGPIEIPNGASLLDGLAMDACGNLYVIVMSGKVYRVWTDGRIEELVDIGGFAFIPALNFGYPPVGGWGNDQLYVLDFLGNVYEVDAGVPGKWEPHLPPAN